jgi:hypothetical protein
LYNASRYVNWVRRDGKTIKSLGDFLNEKEAELRRESFDNLDVFDVNSIEIFRKAGNFGNFMDRDNSLPRRDFDRDPELRASFAFPRNRRISGVSSISSIPSKSSEHLLSQFAEEHDDKDSDRSDFEPPHSSKERKGLLASDSTRSLMSHSTAEHSQPTIEEGDEEMSSDED